MVQRVNVNFTVWLCPGSVENVGRSIDYSVRRMLPYLKSFRDTPRTVAPSPTPRIKSWRRTNILERLKEKWDRPDQSAAMTLEVLRYKSLHFEAF